VTRGRPNVGGKVRVDVEAEEVIGTANDFESPRVAVGFRACRSSRHREPSSQLSIGTALATPRRRPDMA